MKTYRHCCRCMDPSPMPNMGRIYQKIVCDDCVRIVFDGNAKLNKKLSKFKQEYGSA